MMIYLLLIDTPDDKRKFEKLYIAYKQTMFYVANRILKNEHSSEDVVHQAFMRVIDHLDKIDDVECHKTRAFLVTITEHIAIDYYRKIKKENLLSYDDLEIYIHSNQDILDECSNEIATSIAQLPINYSIVLRLKYSQGYNDKEISQILHISEENVRQRISRAKKKLTQILNRGK